MKREASLVMASMPGIMAWRRKGRGLDGSGAATEEEEEEGRGATAAGGCGAEEELKGMTS